MKRWAVSLGCMLACAGICYGQAGTMVRVLGGRVNLRARADMNAEVVAQAGDGDLLTARSFQGEWVEVVPPESVDLWVHRDFVAEGKVSATKLLVRGGPGINYSTVGELEHNHTVRSRGEFGEWLKIAPPPGSSLWVSREYVEVLQPDKPRPPPVRSEPPPQVAEAPPSRPVATVPPSPSPRTGPGTVSVPAPPPSAAQEIPVPSDLKLIPLEGQGKMVQREGVLRLAGFVIGRPSRYRLVRQEGNRIETICYIRGNRAQLSSLVGRHMLVRGREYWVRGVRDPIVVPEQIVPRAFH